MKGLLVLVFIFCTKSLELHASELDKIREQNNFDSCYPKNINSGIKNKFADQIEFWINYYLSHEVDLEMSDINPYYRVKDPLERISLSDIKFCKLTTSSLNRSLKNMPDQKTISLLNSKFIESMNSGDKEVTANKLLSCLALEESLGDPDTNASKKIFMKIMGKSVKPAGVKFYIDPLQKKESELNIGLYQFTPNSSGNINPCLKAWNNLYKEEVNCQIKNKSDVLNALGAPSQNFNVFCGIHKIIETASIQMRSQLSSAKFNPQSDCVSLQMKAGLAYNHFGPFQNSTGQNLASLVSCMTKI